MIALTCTSCKTVLSIDDAFAGGVCRCQHCGTIQTVPAKQKVTRAGVPPAPMPAAKTLYQRVPPGRSGSGLSALTEGAGSGLGSGISGGMGSGLSAPRNRATAPKDTSRRNLPPLLIIAGAVIVVLVGVIIYLTTRPAPPPPISGPAFGDIPLDGATVIYLIDRSDSTKPVFADLKELTVKSAQSLGPDRQFAIMFWNNGTFDSYPLHGTSKSTPGNAEAARRTIEEVPAFGQAELKPALEKAIEEKPTTLVIATSRGWDLDDSFVSMVNEVTADKGIQIHCVTIGAGGSSKSLEEVAKFHKGQYREVTEDQLRSWAR